MSQPNKPFTTGRRAFLQGMSAAGLAGLSGGAAFATLPAAPVAGSHAATGDARFDPAVGNWPPYAAAIPAGRGHAKAARAAQGGRDPQVEG